MSIPTKASESILRNLNRIRDRSFEDENIRLLLIDIRQYCKDRKELYEVAHFLAHPDERDRGISLDFIDRFYIQLQIAYKVLDLSNISKKVYETLLSTIENSVSDVVQKITAMTAAEGVSFFKKAYAFHVTVYQVNPSVDLSKLEQLIVASMTSKPPKPALSQDNLIIDLFETVRNITEALGIKDDYSSKVLEHADEILLCIYCNLHDVRLKLYDGQIVKGHLSVRCVGGPDAVPKEKLTLHIDSAFELMQGFIQGFQFAVSHVQVYSYCSEDAKELFAFGYVDPFPCCIAKRVSGQLQLFKNS